MMSDGLYELQGYTIVLDKVAFITRIFESEKDEGFQFNIRFAADVRLAPKFATRNEAELARELLVQALRSR